MRVRLPLGIPGTAGSFFGGDRPIPVYGVSYDLVLRLANYRRLVLVAGHTEKHGRNHLYLV